MPDPLPDSAANIPPKDEAPPADSTAPPSEPGKLPTAETQDDKTFGMLAHLLGIFTGFLGPLIIWLIKKDQSKFVNDQAKEALNFQILMLILNLVAAPISCFILGVANGAIWVMTVVFCIMAALEANKGTAYRYPLNIRLIK